MSGQDWHHGKGCCAPPSREDARPFDAPFVLGPFIVDHTGRLQPDAGAAPAFRITWRARAIHVVLRRVDEGLGELALALTLGRIPSTASAGARLARDTAFATVRRLPEAMPQGWTMALLADHRILLRAEMELALPVSAASLVTELSLFLLKVDPYLTLLEEDGLGIVAPA
jgi:hypothetical protein